MTLPHPARSRQTNSRRRWQGLLAPVTAETEVAAPRPIRAPARSRRAVTIEQLLGWAYADQQVHRYLRRPLDWFLWAMDQAGMVEQPRDRRPVHHDAALVHEAVMRLGEERAHLVFHVAATGDRPERCTAEPRPEPVEPWHKLDRYGRYVAPDGTMRNYLILTAEAVSIADQEWVAEGGRNGRKKMRHAGTRRTRYEVDYCPIAWHPDPAYIAFANALAATWDGALAELRRTLAGAELTAHVLICPQNSDSDQ